MKNELESLVLQSGSALKKFQLSGHALESSGDLVITADSVSSDTDLSIRESVDGKTILKANNIYINDVDMSNDNGVEFVAKKMLFINYGSFFGYGERPAQGAAMSFKP